MQKVITKKFLKINYTILFINNDHLKLSVMVAKYLVAMYCKVYCIIIPLFRLPLPLLELGSWQKPGNTKLTLSSSLDSEFTRIAGKGGGLHCLLIIISSLFVCFS